MSVYLSRNQPRRQTVIAGKIKDVQRYDRYYDLTYDALQKRLFPRTTLDAGQLVVRVMKGPYNARSIPPGSSTGTWNRFNGSRLDGRPGQGALYVGTVTGTLREYTHYSLPASGMQPEKIWRPGVADASKTFMQGQRAGAPPVDDQQKFYLFRVNQTLHFADLRTTALTPFMTQLLQGGAQRYGIVNSAQVDFLATAAAGPEDYSAPRAIADAIYDLRGLTGLSGVCAYSSRADSDSGMILSSGGDSTGGLIYAIFGPDSSEVRALTPVPQSATQAGFNTFAALSAAAGI